jgi:hypothetical protein
VTAQALGDLVSDFDVAVDRLRRAAPADSTEQRRALRDALACLYELREYRENVSGGKQGYWTTAASCEEGQVTEGIVCLRGKMVHELIRAEPQIRPLAPSNNLYPSDDLAPGANLTWLQPGEMANPPQPRSSRDPGPTYYANVVAGRPVLPTLAMARRFLVEPTTLGPL